MKTYLRRFWNWLTIPSILNRERDQRQQARLLSALFLAFMPVGFIIAAMPKVLAGNYWGIFIDPDIQIMLGVSVVGLIVYYVSRTRHYIFSAITVVCVSSFAIFAASMPEQGQNDYVGYYYLIIPILIASFIFSTQLAILFVAIDLIGLYFVPFFVPEYSFDQILISPFRFIFTMSVVVLLATKYRNVLENNRQIELAESEARYRALMEQSSEGIVLYDLETKRVVESNRAYQAMLGYTAEEMLNLTVYNIVAGERSQIDATIEMIKQHQRWFIGERQHYRKDGSQVDVEANANLLRYGERTVMCTTVRAITERKRAETILKESNERLLTILDGIDADVYVADMTTHQVLFTNQHMRESFACELQGQVCWQVFRGEPGPCPHCTNSQLIDADGKPTGVVVWEGQNPITHKWYLNYDRAIDWIDGRLVRLQIATDITPRKKAEEQLRYLSMHDTLTGLHNRAFFEEELVRLQHSGQFPISIIMVDVNGLKQINDTLGHAAGDDALRRAATILKRSFRADDFGARVGGDEFVVVLTKTDAPTAGRALLRLKSLVVEHNAAFPDLPLGFAAGIATAEPGDQLDMILQQADRNMYQDKQHKA